jgi:hypothetical protein
MQVSVLLLNVVLLATVMCADPKMWIPRAPL